GQNVVYLNKGDGHFDWPGSAHPFGPNPNTTQSVVVGDVDRDGFLDLITNHVIDLNTGVGGFYNQSGPLDCNNPPLSQPTFRCFGTSSDATTDVAIGDMDGDGDLDLVTAHSKFQEIAVYPNDGKGNFDWPGSNLTFGFGDQFDQYVTLGDV